VVVSPRPIDWADEAIRRGDDAVDFLTRIREVLA
jgi:hypothetical protein